MNRNRKKLLALSICHAGRRAAAAARTGTSPAADAGLGGAQPRQPGPRPARPGRADLPGQGPEQALAAFNDRSGEFVRGQYYIFVLGEDGTMQASSGRRPAWWD